MRDRLPFGTRVHVTANIRPVYLTWQTTRTVYDPSPSGGFRMGREVTLDPPILIVNDDESDHVGLQMPGGAEVPERGVHRRLRRFFDGAPGEGVVIGWVVRAEGEYAAPSGGRDPWTGEADYDPGGLTETGRHRLYQVAMDPGEVGQRFHPANILLVHPDDVRPLLTEGTP